jgi:hypothetical protein
MTPPSRQPTNAEVKFSRKRLALAFAIAGISDAIGAFATPLPPLVWVVDFVTALLLFLVLGRQWLLFAGTGSRGDSGLRGASILAAGGWSDCCPGHSQADVSATLMNRCLRRSLAPLDRWMRRQMNLMRCADA